MRRLALAAVLAAAATCWSVSVTAIQNTGWRPADGPLKTQWAKDVSPDSVLISAYPRPQLLRQNWQSLNGLWDYAIVPREQDYSPMKYDGQILVPFPIESALSGAMKRVREFDRLIYRRTFTVPSQWRGQRVLLHFGAIDWEASVSVNGTGVGLHRGGYDEFTLDITDALKPTGPQDLTVSVLDPTDTGTQPRGKQVNRPTSIWYTSVTGIWQTVWLEPVPDLAIDALTLVPDVDAMTLSVTVGAPRAKTTDRVQVVAMEGTVEIGRTTGGANTPLTLSLPNARLWSPTIPKLYDLRVTLGSDSISSYFGMRKTSLCKDAGGATRMCLNNTPLFQVGPLDQGWWPDGLYTAPTDAALRYDLDVTKRLGFNMIRKHVKVEPDRWYYWADRLGILVWQDMPSTSLRGTRTPESSAQFERELKALIDGRRNHPSIVMWVPFNEGWGQYDTPRIVDWIKQYDPSRLVDNASGWTDAKVGDVSDIHRHPGPGSPPLETARAGVLGEFGGLGLPLAGHTWQDQANWSYRGFTTRDALTDAYVDLIKRLHPLLGTPHLSAAVYTQTTDVEIEVNGLMTYDRALIKPDEARVRDANLSLFTPPPLIANVIDSSRDAPIEWRFTTTAPGAAATWTTPDFSDAGWSVGPAGFGTRNTPGAVVRTTWNSPDIWLRRSVDLPAGLTAASPYWLVHHDEDAEIYVNGVLAQSFKGYSSDYEMTPLSAEARAAFRNGRNVIAVHCHQTTGGQYIDVGVVDLIKPK